VLAICCFLLFHPIFTTPSTAAVGNDPGVLQAGTPAPNFVADGGSGGTIRLSDYRGKIVVLDFWATWCGPCMRSMPGLSDIAARYANSNVVVIAVCSWDDHDTAANWIHAHPSNVNYAIDPAGENSNEAIARTYGVTGIPTTFIIDPNGTITDGGGMYESDIADDLAQLGAHGSGAPISRQPAAQNGYEVGHADRSTVVISRHIELKGYMSAKAVDPYAGLTEPAALAKAKVLQSKGRFDDLVALTRSMGKRGMTKSLGPIYNVLGDRATGQSKPDEAWGWYLLTTIYAHDPALIAHARFGIADYMRSIHNAEKAHDQWQAIVDLTGVDDVDKVRAQSLMDSTK